MDGVTYPYNDEYMVVDELTGHYVLTEAALLSRGIDLRARLSKTSTVSPENVVKGYNERISEQIYWFIHEHSFDTQKQDFLILTIPSLRQKMFRALLAQTIFVYERGDGFLDFKIQYKLEAIDNIAKGILGENLPELNKSILYTGV